MKIRVKLEAIVEVNDYHLDDYLLTGGDVYYLSNDKQEEDLIFPELVFYDDRGNPITERINVEEYTLMLISKE